VNTAILSALSALFGSTIGAVASIATTWLTQHYQGRAQHVERDTARRERLFTQFIDLAAKLYANALTQEMSDISVLMPLYALKSQINLFSREATSAKADEVVRKIVDTYYAPAIDFRNRRAVREGERDLLQDFTEACRAELVD
jgi:hypothetical protein